jgi:hypothetical protein
MKVATELKRLVLYYRMELAWSQCQRAKIGVRYFFSLSIAGRKINAHKF